MAALLVILIATFRKNPPRSVRKKPDLVLDLDSEQHDGGPFGPDSTVLLQNGITLDFREPAERVAFGSAAKGGIFGYSRRRASMATGRYAPITVVNLCAFGPGMKPGVASLVGLQFP